MYSLYPFQDYGAAWLSKRKRALLGDGPRCGKTSQTIVACDLINARAILVVCPGIARENWGREIEAVSLFGRPVSVVLDKDDPIEPNGWTVVSMDGARNDSLHSRVMRHRWDVLIVDEQQFLANRESQRTRQVLSAGGFASQADRIWFVTGTPLLNDPSELWVVLRTIGVYKGSFEEFQDRFCEGYFGDYGFVVRAMKNVDELKAMLARVMLRRTYRELFPDAPRPTWQTVELDPTLTAPEDVTALADLENHPQCGRQVKRVLARVAAGEKVDWAAEIPRSNFAMLRRLTAAAKTKPLAHWLRAQLEARVFDKVVVFAHHSAMIETLARDLRGFGAAAVSGATKDRQVRIDAFKMFADCRVLVCQDQIARTAIDLTPAHTLVFAEMDPVPNNNFQAAMRVQGHRQTKPVTIYAAHLPNSTDEQITTINLRKTKMEAELFG